MKVLYQRVVCIVCPSNLLILTTLISSQHHSSQGVYKGTSVYLLSVDSQPQRVTGTSAPHPVRSLGLLFSAGRELNVFRRCAGPQNRWGHQSRFPSLGTLIPSGCKAPEDSQDIPEHPWPELRDW